MEEKKKKASRYVWIGGVMAIFIFAMCLTVYSWSEKDKVDLVSLLGVFFSGLAFGGVIITVIMQKEELELQREELKQTRAVFLDQNETLTQQKFENTFFELLKLHQEIIGGLTKTVESRAGIGTGRICFGKYCQDINFKINDLELRSPRGGAITNIKGFTVSDAQGLSEPYSVQCQELAGKRVLSLQDIRDRIYLPFHREEIQAVLGHYFRHLYRTIKFVDDASTLETDEERYFYIKLFRAQLSSAELVLLFYSCLTEHGTKLKPLIEKYSLFKNFEDRSIPDFKFKGAYLESAFKPVLRASK